jgi:Skp family chaperone for outer membrane proteins
MKNLLSTALFLVILAVSAAAQSQPASIKIAFMNTDAFYDDKIGITKIVVATKQLNNEFAAQFKALEDGGMKLQNIAKEIDTMRKLPQAQFNQTAYNSKQEEGERLQRELTYKKTELETAINKRRTALIAPISQDVGNAMDEFAKKNNYTVIFDVAKLGEAGTLLFLADSADVTKDFIAFYNARPATAAATTAKPPVKP